MTQAQPTGLLEVAAADIDHSVSARFEHQVERYPTRLAARSDDEAFTYAELNREANRLAHAILGQRAPGAEPIALLIDNRALLLVAVLAVLKAGKFYVVLDPGDPSARHAALLADAETELLIYGPDTAAAVADLPPGVCETLDMSRVERAFPDVNPGLHIEPDAYLNLLYTSGSSGRPKGVLQTHRNLLHAIRSSSHHLRLSPDDRFALLSPPATGVWSALAFASLLTGGATFPFDVRKHGLAQLSALLVRERITVYYSLPSVLRNMLQRMLPDHQIPSLRCVKVGAEPLLRSDVALLRPHVRPDCEVQITYGTTETYAATWNKVRVDECDAPGVVPVGYPDEGRQILLLGEDGRPVGPGEVGTIFLKSRFLSPGYWQQPELTEAVYTVASDGERIYRLGDVGRLLPDGQLEHLGRQDLQVKVRGHLVALPEVETALRALDGVGETVVVGRDAGPDTKRLIAYLVPSSQPAPNASVLRAQLAATLPEHMLPSAFVVLDRLPMLPNGKIDVRSLPAPGSDRPELATAYVAPRTPLEEQLAEIWCALLGVERVGVHDEFGDLGGDSVQAAQVLARAGDACQVDLPLSVMFEAGTVAELAEAISERLTGEIGIARRSGVGPFPLSFAQQRVWLQEQLNAGASLNNITGVRRLRGPLHLESLHAAYAALVARHEPLRTTFGVLDGQPVQMIQDPRSLEPELIDVSLLARAEQEAEIERLIEAQTRRPFDLTRDLMLRVQLIRLAEREHLLVQTSHHIAVDGWSAGIMAHELSVLYSAFLAGNPAPPLAELPINYRDFAIWQHEWLQGATYAGHVAYWQRQLAGAPSLMALPTDRPRPASQTFKGSSEHIQLSAELLASLKALSRQEGVTLFMTLLAALDVLLHRVTGQAEVVVGSPIAGRQRLETEGLIGCFINTLVLRTSLSDDPSFRELLARVREVTVGAYAHADVPFEKVVEVLRPVRDPSFSPVFQVLFAFQNVPSSSVTWPDLDVAPHRVVTHASQFDLSLLAEETPDGLTITAEFSTDLFERASVARLLGHFHTLLEGAVANPDLHLADLPLLTQPERQQLLVDWNATHFPVPEATLPALFQQQVERSPDAVAAVFEGQQLSYRQLDQRANQLAHHLQALGVGPDVLVALCLERSLDMLVGLLGTLKAGGAYVPLDPDDPAARLEYMLTDAQPVVLLTHQSLRAHLSGFNGHVVCLDTDWPVIAARSAAPPVCAALPDNLAYAIYTSGSTGMPKGVLASHRGTVNRLAWMWDQFPFEPDDVCCQKTRLSFVDSVWEIFGPLLGGVPTVILSEHVVRDPQALVTALVEGGITRIVLVPSLLDVLLSQPGGLDDRLRLRLWTCSGEALPDELWQRFQRRLPGQSLLNLYGSSEVAADATHYLAGPATGGAGVPIGRPIANMHAYVLDDHMQPLPIGVAGELYIGGVGLARGYLNRPALTAERFVPDPFGSQPGARLYRTGDRVRYLPDGNLEFLGRLDHQVKLRGFRIELGEIEAHLSLHPAVRQAAVLARDDTPDGSKRLVAYVVAAEGAELSPRGLRSYLGQRLPEYMVPALFVVLDTFPLTPSGKLDRQALPPDLSRPDLNSTYTPPRTLNEQALADIWAELLGLERVGVHDDFFELGGHSLLAVRVFARIHDRLGVNLPIVSLFPDATIEHLARMLDQAVDSPARTLVPIQPRGTRPPIFCVHPIDGEVVRYAHLARHLGPDQPVYGLRARGLDGQDEPFTDIAEMAAHYVDQMRSAWRGPYVVGGFSSGGVVAVEMANQLVERGDEVALLAIFDTPSYRSSGTRAARLGRALRGLPADMRAYAQHARAPGQRLRFLWRQLPGVWQALAWLIGARRTLPHMQELERLLSGIADSSAPHHRVAQVQLRALARFRPRPYSGRITLFRAQLRPLLSSHDPVLGWDQLAFGGVDMRPMPGRHAEMFEEPHVLLLAQELSRCLAAAFSDPTGRSA